MIQKFLKYSLPLALGVLVLAGCKEDDDVTVGEWNAVDGYANIAFVETSKSIELDPADLTTDTIHMTRPDSVGSVTVPVEITSGDTEIFSIEPAVFADGETVADVVINFPNAEVGTTYTIQYAVKDPKYVSYYSSNATGTFSVTRVKWNPAGYVISDGQRYDGYAMYTEDFLTGIYQVENVSYPVEVQERDDKPGIYRIKNPYDEKYPYNDPGDWDDTQDYYIVINATNPDKVYMDPYDFYLGLSWSYGAFVVRNLAGRAVAIGADASDYYGKMENGAITFPASSFYIGMDEYEGGGFRWYANPNGAFRLLLDPSKDIYVAELNAIEEDGDFVWNKEFEGIFTSAQQGTTDMATVYSATCTVTTDGANETFHNAYGTPYCIEAPYAEGYNIYFFVKDGRITIPNDFKEALEIQPLGFQYGTTDIYGKINASDSYITANEVNLSITFQNADGSIIYGTESESVANITWTKQGEGTFYYDMFSSNEDGTPEADPGYTWYKRDDKEDVYKIGDWLMGTDFVFSWDKTTNECFVALQSIGYSHPTYGPMYIVEGAAYAQQFAEHTSYYDPATKVFHFFPLYFVEAGYFGQVEELFEVTAEGAVKHKATRYLGGASLLKQSFWQWQGKKVVKPTRAMLKTTLRPENI